MTMIGKTIAHYKILEKLGEGDVGVVYKARDLKLDRFVALKFLSPHLGVDEEEKKRFIREAQAASALDHPNICTIYEIDETEDGQMFIAMAYYEGETLRERLAKGDGRREKGEGREAKGEERKEKGEKRREKGEERRARREERAAPIAHRSSPFAMTVADTIDLAIQIAQGLAEAHQHGIIHRDIKPANIMVTNEGVVKILDFGLAKLAGAIRLTKTGSTLGTPAYMSPEQASLTEVDHRTDIWSLGVVLYEMITGQLPFKGEYEQAVIYSILYEAPEPITPPGLPMELQRIVAKAMTKNPGERYQLMDEMLIDLRTLKKDKFETSKERLSHPRLPRRKRPYLYAGVAALLILLIGFGLSFFAGSDGAIDSVAVLPFANAGADPSMEYLSDGITESIINSLSQLPNLKVISRTSVFRYKGQAPDIETVGRKMRVRAVLTGRVVQLGDNLSISAELVEVRNNRHLWGEQYNRKLADLLAVQEELAQQISQKLRIKLTGEEKKRLGRRYTENMEAYQLHLKGRYHWNKRTAEGLEKGIEYFNQAIAKDPAYALAYVGLADCYALLPWYDGLPPKEAVPRAKAAVTKALEIDNALAEAHASLALIRADYEWDWLAADREFKRAIELNPNYATARQWYAHSLSRRGRVQEAIAEIKRAQELDPLSLIILTNLGEFFYYGRQYDQAIEQCRKVLEMDASFVPAHYYLGRACVQRGMHEPAIAALQKAINLSAGSTSYLAALGHAYAAAGKTDEAKQILAQLKGRSKPELVLPYYVAEIHAGLDENEQALEWLQKAFEARAPVMTRLKTNPIFDNLRSDPRFSALLKKMGLEN